MDFSKVLSPEEILSKLGDLTRPFPGVRAMRLLCSEDSPNSITCVIYADQQASAVAGEIGGFMYGDMPVRIVAPLADGFRCEGRRDDELISHFCAKCSVIN